MKREERSRLARLLEQDKEEMNEESKRAALADFTRVAAEYFELLGEVGLTLSRSPEGFLVSLDFHAVRVKNFTSLRGRPQL